MHQFKEMRQRRSREISFLPRSRVYTEMELHINTDSSPTLVQIVTVSIVIVTAVGAERNRGSTFRTYAVIFNVTLNECFIARVFFDNSSSYHITIANWTLRFSIKGYYSLMQRAIRTYFFTLFLSLFR